MRWMALMESTEQRAEAGVAALLAAGIPRYHQAHRRQDQERVAMPYHQHQLTL